MQRELPKAGEIWRHYRGKSCLILGVLTNGDARQPLNPIVAIELLDTGSSDQLPESSKVITRFYRSLDDFRGEVADVYRFDRIDEDELIWRSSLSLDISAQA